MKKSLFLLFLISTIAQAQYTVKGNLSSADRYSAVYLYKVEGAKQLYVNNAQITKQNNKGIFQFALPSTTKPGIYRAIYDLQQRNAYVEFLFNKENVEFRKRHVRHSLSKAHGQRATHVRSAPTTIEQQEIKHPLHVCYVHIVTKRCPNPRLAQQSGVQQVRQISRQRGRFDIQRVSDFASWNTVRQPPHKHSKNGQPLGVAEGRELRGDSYFHISGIIEIYRQSRSRLTMHLRHALRLSDCDARQNP